VGWDIDAFRSSMARSAEATKDAYARDVADCAEYLVRLGHDEPVDVTKKDLRRYLAFLSTRGYSKRTISRRVAALRRYFDWLRKQGRIEVNPAQQLSSPSGSSKIPRILSDEDIETMLFLDDPDDPVAVRDVALGELLYGSGLRVGEVCGLHLGDIDLRRRQVTVWGKGGKQRQVPMSVPSCDALRMYLERARMSFQNDNSPGDAVFYNQRGRQLGTRDVRRILDKRSSKPTHPHAMRHTYATHLLDGGADLRAVQELLGHSSLAATQTYTRVSKERMMGVHQQTHPRA
jgi:site-specific recombinase XerD